METPTGTSGPLEALSPEEDRALLERRARALARRDVELEPEPQLSLIELRVRDKRYGVEQRYVRRVLRRPPVTPLPAARAELLGMVAYGGRVLPCFDLALLLGHGPADATTTAPYPKLITLGDADDELALAVDEVADTARARASEIAAAPSDVGGATLLRGVTRDGLHLLDGARLLADPRLRLR